LSRCGRGTMNEEMGGKWKGGGDARHQRQHLYDIDDDTILLWLSGVFLWTAFSTSRSVLLPCFFFGNDDDLCNLSLPSSTTPLLPLDGDLSSRFSSSLTTPSPVPAPLTAVATCFFLRNLGSSPLPPLCFPTLEIAFGHDLAWGRTWWLGRKDGAMGMLARNETGLVLALGRR